MPVDAATLEELHAQLGKQLAALTTGDDWLAWLASARHFHRYSPQNQMLLVLQGATGHVASYRTWQRIPAQDGNRCQVRYGEHGMTILAPMTVTRREIDDETTVGRRAVGFKPVKVFHQGQLVSPPQLTEAPLPKLLTGDNRHQHVWAAAQSHLEDLGYDVEIVTRSPVDTWNGRTDWTAAHVAVSDHLEPPARIKTLLHEWAHIALRHDDRLTGRRDVKEVEAESVAYLVCASIGLDSADYSIPYLAGWSQGDNQLLEQTAQHVLAATAAIIATLETELSIDLTPDVLREHDIDATITTLTPTPPAASDMSAHTTAGRSTWTIEATPLLDAATGETRAVMAGLIDEHHRQRLLDTLADIDNHLDAIVDLCSSAGFDPPRTVNYLRDERAADPERLLTAMIRDAVRHVSPDTPVDQRSIAATMRGLIERAAAEPAPTRPATTGPLAELDPHDQVSLRAVNLTNPQHVISAVRILADIGATVASAGDILQDLGMKPDAVTDALARPHYDPVTAQHHPLWPPAELAARSAVPPPALPPEAPPPSPTMPTPAGVDTTSGTPTQPASNPAPRRSKVVPIELACRIAATADSDRLAALTTAYGLDPVDAAALWADVGIEPELATRVAIATRHGDTTAALADLQAGRPDGRQTDWNTYLPGGPASTLGTAEAILNGWLAEETTALRPATPEMA